MLSPSYYTKLWYSNMLGHNKARFQSSATFTSQLRVTGFQICAIGISYKTPLHRASHIYVTWFDKQGLIAFLLFQLKELITPCLWQ